MFMEHATSKRFFLAPAERNISRPPRTIGGNIALRWSASYRVSSTIYKHLAPLERKLIYTTSEKRPKYPDKTLDRSGNNVLTSGKSSDRGKRSTKSHEIALN